MDRASTLWTAGSMSARSCCSTAAATVLFAGSVLYRRIASLSGRVSCGGSSVPFASALDRGVTMRPPFENNVPSSTAAPSAASSGLIGGCAALGGTAAIAGAGAAGSVSMSSIAEPGVTVSSLPLVIVPAGCGAVARPGSSRRSEGALASGLVLLSEVEALDSRALWPRAAADGADCSNMTASNACKIIRLRTDVIGAEVHAILPDLQPCTHRMSRCCAIIRVLTAVHKSLRPSRV